MQGMSERQYAAHVGLSRGAIQKAKETGRLVQHVDGSIDAVASDARRAAMSDPAKQRGRGARQRKNETARTCGLRRVPAKFPPPCGKITFSNHQILTNDI